jgi:hypothetical protein
VEFRSRSGENDKIVSGEEEGQVMEFQKRIIDRILGLASNSEENDANVKSGHVQIATPSHVYHTSTITPLQDGINSLIFTLAHNIFNTPGALSDERAEHLKNFLNLLQCTIDFDQSPELSSQLKRVILLISDPAVLASSKAFTDALFGNNLGASSTNVKFNSWGVLGASPSLLEWSKR